MIYRDSIKNVPSRPGVYIFKGQSGDPVYIGKAKDLKKRVTSYLNKRKNAGHRLSLLVRNTFSIDHVITTTEKEALILEGTLIKKYRPKYNVILKDDANYPFLKLETDTKYPRLMIVRKLKNDGASYFGPYTSVASVRSTLRLMGSIFPLRKCSTRKIPKRSRPCLNYQLGRCLGPCCLNVSVDDYQEMLDQVRLFLEGRSRELISYLKNVMRVASNELNFEKAARVRDQIKAVESTLERQKMISATRKDRDVIGLAHYGNETRIVVLQVRNGYMVGSIGYTFSNKGETEIEILESFLKQYYPRRECIPSEIILSSDIKDKGLISEWLTESAGKSVSVNVPYRGDRKRLVDMAAENAESSLLKKYEKTSPEIIREIKQLLNLNREPVHIEGIDISNAGGDLAVGAIVSFFRGECRKSGYRNFRIKGVQGIDDYAMMAETVKRRLKKDKPPDLFLIDGGKGHLSVVLNTINSLKLSDPPDVISIAKAHKKGGDAGDKLYIPGRKTSLTLARGHPVLNFFMRLRDETHRRAIGYYRKRARKRLISSELDRIPGVGKKREQALLEYFGDVKSISCAHINKLLGVPGINRWVAMNILDYFKKRPP